MARVHGVAGEWARVRGVVKGLWPLFLGVFVAGVGAATMLTCFIPGLVAFALALAFIGWMVMPGLRRIENFFVGARGEERVSGILQELPDKYHVFNDFVAGGVHVDHVVVGPAGVFAVETKFWKDAVTIEEGHVLAGGRLPSRPPLAQVLKEANLVKETLAKLGWKGVVTPVLAFASDTFSAHLAELQGAVIINSCDLKQSFSTTRVAIDSAELDRLVSLMENNS